MGYQASSSTMNHDGTRQLLHPEAFQLAFQRSYTAACCPNPSVLGRQHPAFESFGLSCFFPTTETAGDDDAF